MTKVAVLQSNYIPWKGYFDIIHDADLFVFYDEVQFTKNDWRNRNILRAKEGLRWISVPVGKKISRSIDNVPLLDKTWQKKHWAQICEYYRTAPFFPFYRSFFEDMYLSCQWSYLHELNQCLIQFIAKDLLGIETHFANSRDYQSSGSGHKKLLELLQSAGAEEYISGPAAKNYIVESDYEAAGIQLLWKDYTGYPEYPQQFDYPFEHGVSILDLLFNVGEDAPWYIWGWREQQ